jgi:Sulfotransferase family
MSLPQPIFILGAPRSFTSVICAMLGQHPETYGVPELNLFVDEDLEKLTQRLKGIRQFQLHGLLRTVAQLYAGEQTILSIDMAYRWILTRLHKSTGEIYLELCHKVAPLRIVDKSPVYVTKSEILKRLHTTFPDAHYLHLVRHPRTQGQSMAKIANGAIAIMTGSIDYSTKPPTLDPQYSWYKMQSNIVDFLSTIPAHQQMRLLGEDLLNEPKVHFEKVCNWLNLSWDEAVFKTMLRPQDSPYACPGPYAAHLGNDPNFLKSPAFRYKPIASSHLDGPLPWREDNKGFIPPIIKLAQEFGYQ